MPLRPRLIYRHRSVNTTKTAVFSMIFQFVGVWFANICQSIDKLCKISAMRRIMLIFYRVSPSVTADRRLENPS